MKKAEYPYAVARIRKNETYLLTKKDIDRLTAAPDLGHARSFLEERGWDFSGGTAGALKDQKGRLHKLMTECLPDDGNVRLFTVMNDYYNVKVALKCAFTGEEEERLFIRPTGLDLDLLKQAFEKHDFSILPEPFASDAKKAYESAAATESGQAADAILDRGAMTAYRLTARSTGSALVFEAADLQIAAYDIKIVLRCMRTGKSRDFAALSVAPTDSVDVDRLLDCMDEGEEKLIEYLSFTAFAGGTGLLKGDYSLFEKWCDDLVTDSIKKAKYEFFGFEPIFAFHHAKLNELKTVNMILTAKANAIPAELITERLRCLYV